MKGAWDTYGRAFAGARLDQKSLPLSISRSQAGGSGPELKVTHTHTRALTHRQTRTDTHARTKTHTHTQRQTHTDTHTLLYLEVFNRSLNLSTAEKQG